MSHEDSALSDDAAVGNDVPLYRLVPTTQCQVVDGQWEFESGAFDNATPRSPEEHPDDMSVVVGDTLEALRRDPRDLPQRTWAAAAPEWGVAVLVAGRVREVPEQEILRTPNDDEPAHGDVRGNKNSGRRKKLKQRAVWIARPTAPPRP